MCKSYTPSLGPSKSTSRRLPTRVVIGRTTARNAKPSGLVPRYLCSCCKRTVSLLPEFALPYLRFGITVIALFLIARLLVGGTLSAAGVAAKQSGMPYQRGQFWIRRFHQQAERLCAALAALTAPPPAPHFVARALHMLQSIGWIAAHRSLFADLRFHLLGWPAFLAPDGRVAALRPAAPPT